MGRLSQLIAFLRQPPIRTGLTLDLALPRLYPKVRPRFLYEAQRLGNRQERPAARVEAGIFAVSLVADFPDMEINVTRSHMEAWGADFDGLLVHARSNLLKRGGMEGFEATRDGFFQSTWEDNLDGSRMLLPGVLKMLPIQGDPVVIMPSRDVLLVTGADDPAALCAALESALVTVQHGNGPLNACPLRLRNFQWEPLRLPSNHPARPLLSRVRRRRLLDEYAHQKALLDQLHGRLGRQIHVSPFHLAPSPGRGTSFTLWSRELGEGWLPEADRVCLAWKGSSGPEQVWVPWEVIRQRLGRLLEPLGLFPQRHRLLGFPEPAELEELVSLDLLGDGGRGLGPVAASW